MDMRIYFMNHFVLSSLLIALFLVIWYFKVLFKTRFFLTKEQFLKAMFLFVV